MGVVSVGIPVLVVVGVVGVRGVDVEVLLHVAADVEVPVVVGVYIWWPSSRCPFRSGANSLEVICIWFKDVSAAAECAVQVYVRVFVCSAVSCSRRHG